MQQELQAESLFNLKTFAHRELFSHSRYVWEALPKISSYLSDLLSKEKGNQILGQISPQAYLINPDGISIGEGTIVEAGAYIEGPCVIGRNCTIRHGAYIRGNVLTGDSCVIGHSTEVKATILLDGAKAAHFAYLGNSVLGNAVNLGAGTRCANLRLDSALIKIPFEGQFIATGLKKFGAIIGDEAQLGCNSVTNPGTIIGAKAMIYPLVNVGGYISAARRVKK